jgi:sulfite reductase (NADPH) flavoprotein alpha-component
MLRKLHSTPGLIAALLLLVVALTGSVLSVFPALDRASAKDALGIDVATLAGRVTARLPGVETLVREASGTIVAYHLEGEAQRASIIDPASGAAVAAYAPSGAQRWIRNLHRKLLLDDAGRVATGVAAACMLLIVLSGLALMARRMGGWKQLFGPVRGNGLQRLHNETSRMALAGLVLSAATGLLMSLTTFGWVPEGGGDNAFFDVQPSAATAMALDRMPALQSVDVSILQQLRTIPPMSSSWKLPRAWARSTPPPAPGWPMAPWTAGSACMPRCACCTLATGSGGWACCWVRRLWRCPCWR